MGRPGAKGKTSDYRPLFPQDHCKCFPDDIDLVLYPLTLDGFAAAYSAWIRLGPDATYFGYYEPADVDLSMVAGITVLVVGPSFLGAELFNQVKNSAKDIVVVARDGKVPTMDQVKESLPYNTIYAANQGLCLSTFAYMHPGKDPSTLMRYIDDYATRSWKLHESNSFAIGFSSLNFSWPSAGVTASCEFDEFLTFEQTGDLVNRSIHGGNAMVGAAQKCAKDLVSRVGGSLFKLGGELSKFKIFAVNCTEFAPQVAKMLLEKDTRADALLAWSHRRVNGKDQYKVTLRSNNPNFDCAAVARMYQGNGWKTNAGFVYHGHSMADILKDAKVSMNPADFQPGEDNPYTNAAMQQEILLIAQRSFVSQLKTHEDISCAVVNCSSNMSEVAAATALAHPKCEFVLAWHLNHRTQQMEVHLKSIEKEGKSVSMQKIAEGYQTMGGPGDDKHVVLRLEGDSIATYLC